MTYTLLSQLKDSDTATRNHAATVLARIGAPAVEPLIIALVNSLFEAPLGLGV
jgi:HEAT repeat protein